jgi:hypothetical protein
MSDLYKIHFGFSKSKRYPQAVELAKLANKHEIRGEGEDVWHIVTFTNEQIDLMASFYKIAGGLPYPKIYGAEVLSLILYLCEGYEYSYNSNAKKNRIRRASERLQIETEKTSEELASYLDNKYWKTYQQDMTKVNEKLRNEGYLDSFNYTTMRQIEATKRPKELLPEYQKIRKLISNGKYEDAVNKYYNTLGDRFYGELHNELIYLKRLTKIPLTGRDLLYFRSESSRNELINSNLSEYCSCIDKALEQYREAGLKLPLDILVDNTPTMEELIEQRKHDWHQGVYLWNGKYQRDSTPVTIDSFSSQYDKTPEGRLFDRYPDQVQYCRIIEAPEDKEYKGLWTTYSPAYYQRFILDKGLHLNGIEAYEHNLWRWGKKEPDFTTVKSMTEIKKSDYGTKGIRYTGRSHKINGKIFYEIDLIRNNMSGNNFCIDGAEEGENPFIELVEEVLREAENLLRRNHNLPRIGEGWVSEMQLYNLVKTIFPEAEHHATPEWLKPLHLDVFVPSKKLAFEYQGKQHFEPIDFFGGEKAFKYTQKRDQRKRLKCHIKGVALIEWRYDEPINSEVLEAKLICNSHNFT